MIENKKLIIGTANFSSNYGTFEKHQVNKSQVSKIFTFMKKNEINFLDTAISYNDCDSILGMFNLSKINIISKINFYDNFKISEGFLIKKFENSLKKLNINRIYSLLLHNPMESLMKFPNAYVNMLKNLQKNQIIKKIGISVYSPSELSFCFDMMEFDLVQFPMNVFDNRFLKTGWLDRLKKNNIETHARSIFLQGVITLNKWPNYFNIWNKQITNFNKEILKLEISPIQAAISYINGIKKLDGVIIGINNVNQIKAYLEMKKLNINLNFLSDICSINDEKFVNPTNWQ